MKSVKQTLENTLLGALFITGVLSIPVDSCQEYEIVKIEDSAIESILSNPTELCGTNYGTRDDGICDLVLPFDIDFFGVERWYEGDIISVSTNVLLCKGSGCGIGGHYPWSSSYYNDEDHISPYWIDLRYVKGQSEWTWGVEGVSPHRVLVVYFKDFSYWNNPSSIHSVQLKVREGSGSISAHVLKGDTGGNTPYGKSEIQTLNEECLQTISFQPKYISDGDVIHMFSVNEIPLCEGISHPFAHIYDCKKYWVCDHSGYAWSYECPSETVFNSDFGFCDLPRNVVGVCGVVVDEGLCQGEHSDGYPFANTIDCTQYHLCDNSGYLLSRKCPIGTIFNPFMKYCDWSFNLQDSDLDGLVDVCETCPYDADNDIDGDGICGDVDLCPYDADNDIDGDGICGDVDLCPTVFGENCNSNYDILLVNMGENTDYDDVFETARIKWESVIIGDLDDVDDEVNWLDGYGTFFGSVDDVVIGYRIEDIDGPGSILGRAGPLYIRNSNGLTISGIMVFDVADIEGMDVSGILEGVILHEMGHVLGVGTLWNMLGLSNCPSDLNYLGREAREEFINMGFTGDLFIEGDGSVGTQCGHWDEVQLDRELMTGYAESTPGMPLSKITVGNLEDMGYTVNYDAADDFSPTYTPNRRRDYENMELKSDNLCTDYGVCPKFI